VEDEGQFDRKVLGGFVERRTSFTRALDAYLVLNVRRDRVGVSKLRDELGN